MSDKKSASPDVEVVNRILKLLHDRRVPLRPNTSPTGPGRRKGGKRFTAEEVLLKRLKAAKLWPIPKDMDYAQLIEEMERREKNG